ENALRRLGLAQQRLGRVLKLQERLSEVIASTKEVFTPAVFGVLIIMLVYLPIFALSGVEGKMFHPMAFTVVAALLGALIFSITFVPAAIAILLRGSVGESENFLMAKARKLYQPVLALSLKVPVLMVAIAGLLVGASVWQLSRLGSEFLPQLDEHDIAMHALRIPGTGLDQAIGMQIQLEEVVKQFDEVSHVFSKIGTPEIATDPMPPNVADTFIVLKPVAEWPDPGKTKLEFLTELRDAVMLVPGNKYEFTQPIEMRFNELIAGVRADVAVRIYGDDMAVLAEAGAEAGKLLGGVDGATDVQVEQLEGLPMITVEPERDHLALLGLTVEA
ncbi:MAG: efflux RND transporter permease subunit, partial [Cellvibrionaceae bacterium]|nr:efflux RND transporter permease subunit [Cellvibrionaceae bacterium]